MGPELITHDPGRAQAKVRARLHAPVAQPDSTMPSSGRDESWLLARVWPADPDRIGWVWDTRAGRVTSWMILLVVGIVVAVVKFGGVRAGVAASGPPLLANVLGWLPSYLSAFGMPFWWPAVGKRVRKPSHSKEFLPECIVGGGTILWLEVWDLTDGAHVFAWSDVMAILAGTLTAFLAYRFFVRARRQSSRPTGR